MLKQNSAEYRGYRTPGIRLKEEMIPHLGKVYSNRTQSMLPALHAFDQAHTIMLIEQGVLPRETGIAVLRSIRKMEEEGVVAARMRVGGGLHSGEHYVIRDLGEEIGGRFHVARSSGDLSSVAINVLQREHCLAVLEGINRFRSMLLKLIPKHTGSILPGYSFGQHAQPMTFAHLWLSWVATLERDFARIHGAYQRVNTSPAGAAIMVGSDFPIDRERTADLLGFDAVHENCADAILELTADDSLEVPMVFSILCHSMAKWADDLILWTTREFDFVEIPDRFCGTSSIMMQKKNVIGPAELKANSAEAIACVVSSYHALKGPTGLPINERYQALDMLWRVGESLVAHMDWFGEFLPELTIRTDYLREHSWRHWATATDLASALVRGRDMPWRTAHQIVGILVRLSEERGLTPADVTPELLDEAAMLYHEKPVGFTREEIMTALDPVLFVEKRTLLGGPAPNESLRQVGVFTARLDADEAIVEGIHTRLAAAETKLRSTVDELIA
ncbi:argininosuccinate lyase [Ancylobacter mangrovi]|uniref:argininosuccinate lyase n=1 Tax=Ancylobacter mangrovi TaxID=2972472 RepID=UPI002161F13B|nr:argininosuccinate lyase [Ancylobacter mangrovi]MCS0503175.1 argininosuccinate lyase [Ancylobacter mangrovi]